MTLMMLLLSVIMLGIMIIRICTCEVREDVDRDNHKPTEANATDLLPREHGGAVARLWYSSPDTAGAVARPWYSRTDTAGAVARLWYYYFQANTSRDGCCHDISTLEYTYTVLHI